MIHVTIILTIIITTTITMSSASSMHIHTNMNSTHYCTHISYAYFKSIPVTLFDNRRSAIDGRDVPEVRQRLRQKRLEHHAVAGPGRTFMVSGCAGWVGTWAAGERGVWASSTSMYTRCASSVHRSIFLCIVVISCEVELGICGLVVLGVIVERQQLVVQVSIDDSDGCRASGSTVAATTAATATATATGAATAFW